MCAHPELPATQMMPPNRASTFRRAYLNRMLALPLLDLGVTGIFIFITGRFEVVPKIVAGLLLLGAATLAAGIWLYGPIADFEQRRGNERRASLRIQNLPKFSGLAAFVLVLVYCGTAFALKVFTPAESALADVPTWFVGAAILWYALVYASFYAYFIYFFVSDLTLTMRRHFRETLQFAPRRASGNVRLGLARKLGVIFVIISLLPALLLALDLTVFEPLRSAQGLSTGEVIALDLIASLYIIAASVLFVSRSLLAPARELFRAQENVRRGDLESKAAVLTDDELGEVTSRFNVMVDALRERELIKSALHRYLSPTVADELIKSGGLIESKSVEATVMFTDIAGFTTLSESLAPHETVDLLNAYFSVLNAVIHRCGGTVNNFVGDAVVAIFNVPTQNPQHARAAIEAAIAIQAALDSEQFTLSSGRRISLPTRIGLNTGFVCAGSIGAAERQGYTVYGDAVNLAARIEPLNKRYGTRILASESTVAAALLQGLAPDGVSPLGRTAVAGRREEVMVYRVETIPPQ